MIAQRHSPEARDIETAAAARGIDGMIDNSQCEELVYLARVAPASGINIEIGAYKGKSTRAIMDGLGLRKSLERFYSADPFVPAPSDAGCGLAYEAEGSGAIRDAFYINIANVPANVSVYCTGTKSSDLWDLLPNRPIRFAFVDGDHSFDAVVEDAVNIMARIAADGIIVFDDYEAGPVKEAIDEFVMPKAAEEWHIGGGRMKVLRFDGRVTE